MDKSLFFITSVINTTPAPLSYAQRSVFSHQQRFEQTVKTIESIRKHCPEAKIALVECSDIDSEKETTLKSLSDYYYNLYYNDNKEYIQFIRNSPCKALGESCLTIGSIDFLVDNGILDNFDNIFKISGRYFLNDNFKFENFVLDKINIKMSGQNSTTTLFSLPKDILIEFRKFLINNIPFLKREFYPYEALFTNFVIHFYKEKTNYINEKLGIAGYVTIDGTYFEL